MMTPVICLSAEERKRVEGSDVLKSINNLFNLRNPGLQVRER